MQRKQIKKFIFKIDEVYWIFLHTKDFEILFWMFIEQNNEKNVAFIVKDISSWDSF